MREQQRIEEAIINYFGAFIIYCQRGYGMISVFGVKVNNTSSIY